jgi:tetratricopeptide (TPR) repeat protein
VVVACVALGLLSSSSTAYAADVDKSAAKAHYEAATRLYDVHEYEAALKEYKEGYLAKPDPAFLFNIGQCYRRLGKTEQALEFFREYLRKAAPDDPNRAQVEARIREAPQRDDAKAQAPLAPSASNLQPPPASETTTVDVAGAAPGGTHAQGLGYAAMPPPSGNQSAGLDLTSSEAPTTSHTPLYRQGWVWVGVGAAVVAVTVTTLAITHSGGGGDVAGTTLGTRKVFQ